LPLCSPLVLEFSLADRLTVRTSAEEPWTHSVSGTHPGGTAEASGRKQRERAAVLLLPYSPSGVGTVPSLNGRGTLAVWDATSLPLSACAPDWVVALAFCEPVVESWAAGLGLASPLVLPFFPVLGRLRPAPPSPRVPRSHHLFENSVSPVLSHLALPSRLGACPSGLALVCLLQQPTSCLTIGKWSRTEDC